MYQHFQSLNLYNSAWQKTTEVSLESKFVVLISEEHWVDLLGQGFEEEAKNFGGIVSDSSHPFNHVVFNKTTKIEISASYLV